MFFTIIIIGLKKFATPLPNNRLAGTPQALALMRLGTVGGKGGEF
ncbi:hypothetical protein [Bacillus sp. SD075]|nr:hypothetical protein [Bacillus sp. SD075]